MAIRMIFSLVHLFLLTQNFEWIGLAVGFALLCLTLYLRKEITWIWLLQLTFAIYWLNDALIMALILSWLAVLDVIYQSLKKMLEPVVLSVGKIALRLALISLLFWLVVSAMLLVPTAAISLGFSQSMMFVVVTLICLTLAWRRMI